MANLVHPHLPETSEEVLYRHIHPTWLDDGEPSSQAFRPFDPSNIHLSVDLSSKVASAAEAAQNFKGDSVGVYGVTPKECHSQELKTYWAPEKDNVAHGAIDYTGVDLKKPAKRKSQALARMARDRKRLHPPLNATEAAPQPEAPPQAEAAPQSPQQPNGVHPPAEATPPRGNGNQTPW